MKKIFVSYAAVLALLFASCAKSEVETPAGGNGETGTLSLRILTETRSSDGSYDPMDYCTIRIYSSEGLIRKYTSVEEMPEALQLLTGTYSISVEAGDMSAASFTNKSYRGEREFVIEAGKESSVEVVCPTLNATVAVDYDASVAENLEAGFSTTVRMGGEMLEYPSSAEGYFLPAAEDTELSWSFSGVHPERGEVAQSGTVAVKAGGRYNLKFAYSADAAGLLSFTVTVEEPSPENGGDVIIFSPEPTFKGDGFDMSVAQKVYNTTRNILVASPNPLNGLTLTVEGVQYDLAGGTAPGVALTRTDETNWIVTLSDELFSSLTGGDHELLFVATDTEGGTGKASAWFTTQGIVPAVASDYDLWANTGSVRVKIFDPSVSSVQVKLRRVGGAWATYDAVRTDDETFAAYVEPTWTEDTNLSGQAVYRPDAYTGIFADVSYEAKAVIAGVEKDAVATFSTTVDQPIPDGDFEDGTLSCFTKNNATTDFWGSGNNDYWDLSKLLNLCTQQSFPGQGGNYCARLYSQSATVLAAGNLFSGTFVKPSTQGTVGFGKDYDWKARPTALRLKYYAEIGTVDLTRYEDSSLGTYPIQTGEQDKARIFVAIVDWTAPHEVSSGMSAPSGMWDPETVSSVDEGAIIGYGSLYIQGKTEGSQMISVDLPISFYDKVTKPSNTYKIVISCSANAYGDYMCGCSSNILYVDDFEWVY